MWSATEGWRGWCPVAGVWGVASVVTRTASDRCGTEHPSNAHTAGPRGRMTDATDPPPAGARVMAEKLTIVDVDGEVPTAVARIERARDRLGVTLFAAIDRRRRGA